ncbi:MAG: M23 family metallopeptidase [Oscillospiraceae bacterium]|nr:M23 family metallopeptidase [Oscillospiraceae bacterium]
MEQTNFNSFKSNNKKEFKFLKLTGLNFPSNLKFVLICKKNRYKFLIGIFFVLLTICFFCFTITKSLKNLANHRRETYHSSCEIQEPRKLEGASTCVNGGLVRTFENKTGEKKSGNNKKIIKKWPVPYTKNITSGFGKRGNKNHKGIDISCKGISGKRIVSIDDGIVIFSGVSKGFGNNILILHDSGVYSRYGHCNMLKVKKNERVNAGDTIATVGNSGDSTGFHLHFELKIKGKNVNPLNFI